MRGEYGEGAGGCGLTVAGSGRRGAGERDGAVRFAGQLRAVRANRGDQLGGGDFVAYFPMDAGLAFVDFDEQYAFTVFGGHETQRAKLAAVSLIEFGQQGHGPGRTGRAH
ncbi:hypothetical protein X949_5340 [Burkholderia pseudomallei MSHR5609]|nr:hypothetical protein DP42_4862 [Burkholderia pseudomallei]KGD40536.1 hypothetical protein DP44_3717 [Burkholderia pseudomallei]KGS54418.1 hypothetical protein X949_5340 [Burkholderia pseudomallei MSHR5609]KGS75120.1 hypothetical protein X942_5342 [Burkholderia pseudomallei MSHR5596]KGX50771.1 hypothetical protein Y025_5312 [Burkholderia pseudomallei TSV32]